MELPPTTLNPGTPSRLIDVRVSWLAEAEALLHPLAPWRRSICCHGPLGPSQPLRLVGD